MTATLQHNPEPRAPKVRTKAPGAKSIFDPAIVKTASLDALRKLNPRTMMRNPVMFIVEVGSVLTTYLFIRDLSTSDAHQNAFAGLVAAWLWFTVLFANFAEAMAEGRGKAQAAALRQTRADTIANVRMPDGTITQKASAALQVGDLCIVVAPEIIPGDGEIVEGIAGDELEAAGYERSRSKSSNVAKRARYRFLRTRNYAEWWISHQRKERRIG